MLLAFILFFSPVAEYDNICEGLEKEFAINSVEFFGYITKDNKLIVSNKGSFSNVESKALQFFNGKWYAMVKVSKTYEGQINNRLGSFVPIKATIHSHNPQCENKVSGLDEMSKEDLLFAKKYNSINHYIYACGGMAQFNSEGFVKVEVSSFTICQKWM